jgi:hypothetical protein
MTSRRTADDRARSSAPRRALPDGRVTGSKDQRTQSKGRRKSENLGFHNA